MKFAGWTRYHLHEEIAKDVQVACISTELKDRAITRVVPRIIRPCFLGAFFLFSYTD